MNALLAIDVEVLIGRGVEKERTEKNEGEQNHRKSTPTAFRFLFQTSKKKKCLRYKNITFHLYLYPREKWNVIGERGYSNVVRRTKI